MADPSTAIIIKPKIIIIGAGVSGLGCAQYLRRHCGDQIDISVVEGRDRIGGRIHTVQMGKAAVDLGASWVHGKSGNVIYEIGPQEFGLKLYLNNEEKSAITNANYPNSTTCTEKYLDYTDSGVDVTEEADKVEVIFDQIIDNVRKLSQEIRQNKNAEDYSILQAITEQVKTVKHDMDENLFNKLINLQIKNLEGYYSTGLDTLSLIWFDDPDEPAFSDDDKYVKNGYSTLINSLAKSIDVRLSHTVSKIFKSNNKINVTTNKETYSGDVVLVTVPLGVLQKNIINFDPPLNDNKQTAIKRLGMGVLNKCILQFSEVFWPKSVSWISYTADDITLAIHNVYKRTGEPILVVYIQPRVTHQRLKQYGNMNDNDLTQSHLKMLAVKFGDIVFKSFKSSYVTSWSQDPFSFGSYGYVAVGASGNDFEVLAQPEMDNMLRFAGEATCRTHQGTVHGAYVSGIREAQKIISLLKLKDSFPQENRF